MPRVISTPEMREEPPHRGWRLVGKLVDRLVGLGIIAILIATLYVLYGLVNGDFVNFPSAAAGGPALGPEAQQRLLGNVQLAANVIFIGSILAILAAILRAGWGVAPAYIAGAWGVLLYLGGPWVLAIMLAGAHKPANEVTSLLGWTLHTGGQVIIVLVLVRLAVGGVHRVIVGRGQVRVPVELTLEESTQERKQRAHRSLMRKCWELSLCQGDMRTYCPAFIARKSCWRMGQGCLCDPLFAQRVMEKAEQEHHVRISAQEREARERIRRQAHLDTSGKARRARCRACPIYDEHQYYKHRALYWIAYPATALLVWAAHPAIHKGYTWFTTVLGRLVAGTALLPNRESEYAPYMSFVVQADATEFVVVLAVAFVVVSYILDLVEYLVFDVKV